MAKQADKSSDNFVALQKKSRNWRKRYVGRIYVSDTFPGPYIRNPPARPRESPEQRAFRRYPISSHKPGGWG